MLKIETDLKDIREVTGNADLEDMRFYGWELIAIVQENKVEVQGLQINCPGGEGEGFCSHGCSRGGCYQSATLQQAVPTTVTRYVMGRNPDVVFGEMGGRLEKAEKELSRAEEKMAEWIGKVSLKHEELLEVTATADKLSEENTKAFNKVSGLNNRVWVHLETINLLEADIGTISTEVGAARVREILQKAKAAKSG